jgi:3-deoxy-D-manno-octulosonate 8-phosphate phosphatase (KDO 8-P phosphatase)
LLLWAVITKLEWVEKKLANIKMLIMDVDGVLTDCRVFLDSSGQWRRLFSIRDGYGISRLMEAGYQTAVITGSKAEDIEKRVQVLKIHHFYQGSLDKVPAFEEIVRKTGLKEEEIAYIGDDLFDIPILQRVGFAATVPDAMDEVLSVVDYVTKRPAGNGAVREVCDFICKLGAYRKGDL